MPAVYQLVTQAARFVAQKRSTAGITSARLSISGVRISLSGVRSPRSSKVLPGGGTGSTGVLPGGDAERTSSRGVIGPESPSKKPPTPRAWPTNRKLELHDAQEAGKAGWSLEEGNGCPTGERGAADLTSSSSPATALATETTSSPQPLIRQRVAFGSPSPLNLDKVTAQSVLSPSGRDPLAPHTPRDVLASPAGLEDDGDVTAVQDSREQAVRDSREQAVTREDCDMLILCDGPVAEKSEGGGHLLEDDETRHQLLHEDQDRGDEPHKEPDYDGDGGGGALAEKPKLSKQAMQDELIKVQLQERLGPLFEENRTTSVLTTTFFIAVIVSKVIQMLTVVRSDSGS